MGDTEVDMLAARDAGVTPVAVASGFCSEKFLRKICDLVFKDLFEFALWLPRRR